jgi:hypothetical protein
MTLDLPDKGMSVRYWLSYRTGGGGLIRRHMLCVAAAIQLLPRSLTGGSCCCGEGGSLLALPLALPLSAASNRCRCMELLREFALLFCGDAAFSKRT